jgi:death-on-curing protein
MNYLSAEQFLFIHSRVIEETGGTHGLRNVEILKPIASRPTATLGGKKLYQNPFQIASALMEAIIKNHPFIYGNRKTAVSVAGIFLQMNGYALRAAGEDLNSIASAMADGTISFPDTVHWFENNSMKEL